MSSPSRPLILGCPIDALTLEETVDRVETVIRDRQPRQLSPVNVDVLVHRHRDPGYAALLDECDHLIADGWPVVAASRLLGRPLPERVATPDLFDRLLQRGDERGWRVYLLGARRSVVERAAARITSDHPGLKVAGWRDGYWTDGEEADVVKAIRDAHPDILFVGISSPRKERFVSRWRDHMNVPLSMGVGGVFDIVAGETRRAPRWLQRLGLEWFYRFLQEPRRMFRRYFIDDLYFFVLLAKAMMRRESRD